MNKQTHRQQKGKSSSAVRTTIQTIFLVLTILVGLRHILPGESSKGGAFDAFCPLGGIETLIPFLESGQTLLTTNLLNFSILLGVLGVSLLAGRAFCGWMCPIGTLQNLFSRLTHRLTAGTKNQGRFPVHFSLRLDSWLRSLKYLILAIILLASTWSIYPPLRDICPARAFFSFQTTTPLLISVLVVFIATSMVNKLFWCKYLCPFGASLAIFNKIAPLRLVNDQNSCTSCGSCDAACPMDIPNVPENLRSAECIQCLECLEACAVKDALHIQLA